MSANGTLPFGAAFSGRFASWCRSEGRRSTMRIRSSLLAGAALFAAGTLGAASALAQGYGHTPQVSTPAEAAETQQLNQQATPGTTQSPATLNGEAASM